MSANSLDEALLEHYDDIMDAVGYRNTLARMRARGYEPKGPGAPLPDSPYYNHGRADAIRGGRDK